MRRWIAIPALSLLAAGCMDDGYDRPGRPGGPGVSTYLECGAARLKVDYRPRFALVSVNGERPIRLRQARSASGTLYQDPRHSLHVKGGEALWTIGRMVPQSCTEVRVPR